MKTDLHIVEWRIIRKQSAPRDAILECVGLLFVDDVPIPTKEPIVVTKRLTPSQSELLDLLLQEEKGQI